MKHHVLLFALILTGCLKTRGELRSEGVDPTPQRQTVGAQRAEASTPSGSGVVVTTMPAPASAGGASSAAAKPLPPMTAAQRADDLDEQLRALTGRVEVVENALNQSSAADDAAQQDVIKEKLSLEQRLLAYEEAIRKLTTDVTALNEQVTALKTPPVAPVLPTVTLVPTKPIIEEAGDLFTAKKWKDAAAAFQKYREQNPKGKWYAEATYKIGVCFQELGLKDEARSFYDEVSHKFPGTKDAKKAAFRSKSLK